MSEFHQLTTSAATSRSLEPRPASRRQQWQTTAVVLGAIAGVLAGATKEMLTRAPTVRSETLAVLPIHPVDVPRPSLSSASPQVSDPVVPRDRSDAAVANHVEFEQRVGPLDESRCTSGMRLVEGDYCPNLQHRCIEPFPDGSGRCKRFAAAPACPGATVRFRYCMDEFEYPNVAGEKPRVMVTFAEAKATCESSGKRLCSAREWTLACEGPDRLPYPYGLAREPGACNVDQPHRFPDAEALDNPATRARELARLDQRTPSGSMKRCVSRFGLADMVGNVDEWVVPDGPEPAGGFAALTALKGGYFGPVRARCRPSTPSHGPTFKFYQVGFRCCADVSSSNPGQGIGTRAGAASIRRELL